MTTTPVIHDVSISPLGVHKDNRGWLTELFRADETPSGLLPLMSYVSCTRPGVSRGPHQHATQTDTFAFITGTWWVKLWDPRCHSSSFQVCMRFKIKTPTVVIVPPGVVHAYANAGISSALVVNLPNVLYRGPGKSQEPDEIRYEGNPAFSVRDITNTHILSRLCKFLGA